MTMTSQSAPLRQIFFDVFLFFLSNLVNGPSFRFHVNIITCSGVMIVFFYKGLNRNPEIRNTPVRVLRNIWRLSWIRDTRFCTNLSNKMFLNAAKCQGYSFNRFWVIKGKGNVKLPPILIWVNMKTKYVS